jgi:hypothetical protein
MTFANSTLYHYEWNLGSGSQLKVYSFAAQTGVPEPGSLALLGVSAVIGLAFIRRARKRARTL